MLLGRFVYSLNWFIISPALPDIASAGRIPLWALGLIPFAFFLSTGAFQIPSGALSGRLGAVRTYVIGLAVLSAGNVLLPLDPSAAWVMLTRVVSGVGSAFFFASAAGVLLGLYPERPGLMMGLYNTAFGLGGAGGLLWGTVHQAIGWQAGVALGGLLGMAVAAVNYGFVRGVDVKGRYSARDAVKMLGDRGLVVPALAFAGTWGSYFAVGQLLPAYQQTVLGSGVARSGLETSLLLFSSIVGGLSSAVYDRTGRRKLLMLSAGALAVLPIVLIGAMGGALILPSLVAMGFFNEMAISMFYAFVNDRVPSGAAAALAMINTVQITLGMLFFPVLSFTSAVFSWEVGWAVLGVGSALPLLLMARVKV